MSDVGDLALRLRQVAALHRAGLAPETAWEPLVGPDDDTGAQARLESWARRESGGQRSGPVAGVLAAHRLAERLGIAPADTLDRLADALEDVARSDAARNVAAAGPASGARLLTWLPVAGIALGYGVGADPLAAVTSGGPAGMGMAAGAVLLAAGRAWARALLRGASHRPSPMAGIALDLLGAALAVGASVPTALEAVGECLGAAPGPHLAAVGRRLGAGASWESAWSLPGQGHPARGDGHRGRRLPDTARPGGGRAGREIPGGGHGGAIRPGGGPAGRGRSEPSGRGRSRRAQEEGVEAIRRALEPAWHFGLAPAPLLHASARQVRAQAEHAGNLATARLGVTLMLPLGLCFLPAFVLMGLVPVLVSIAGDVMGGV